jgi:GT2 family glycosyltransferase
MSLTAVIPTWRRPEVTAGTVRGLFVELDAGDECLVVAQGGPDERRAVVTALSGIRRDGAGRTPQGIWLRVLEQEHPSRCAARNRALRAARGRWIAFLDDDTVPRPGWRSALLAPLLEGRAEVVAGRLWEEPDRTTNAPRAVGGWLTWTGHTRRNYRTDRSGPTGLAPSGNMALGRALARKAGGFDEGFGGAEIYEDVEFSERLRRMGARVVYAPQAEVDHLAVRTGPWWEGVYLEREIDRARHMSLIFRRHRPFGWPLMAAAYLAAAAWKAMRGRAPAALLPRTGSALLRGLAPVPRPGPLTGTEEEETR